MSLSYDSQVNAIPESEIPSEFTLYLDDNNLPNRVLTNFSVHRRTPEGDIPVSICDLDEEYTPTQQHKGNHHHHHRSCPQDHESSHHSTQNSNEEHLPVHHIYARGYLEIEKKEDPGDKSSAQHSSTAKKKVVRSPNVEIGPLLEWCIEYGSMPAMWIHTEKAWYRLTPKPARNYTKIHELARRRFEICARAFVLATSLNPNECTWKGFTSLLLQPWCGMKGYSEREILTERRFIIDQANSVEDPSLKNTKFIKFLKEKEKSKKEKVNYKNMKTSSKMEKTQDDGEISDGSKSPAAALELNPSPLKPEAEKQEPMLQLIDGDNRDKPSKSKAKQSKQKKQKSSKSKIQHWSPSEHHDKDEFRERMFVRLKKILSAIMRSDIAYPFLEPVDPEALGIPDYPDIIKNPMDLGTIKTRLDQVGHYNALINVVRDVRLVWRNCRDFNGEDSELANMANSLEKKFEDMLIQAEASEVTLYLKSTTKKPLPAETPRITLQTPRLPEITPIVTTAGKSSKNFDGDVDEHGWLKEKSRVEPKTEEIEKEDGLVLEEGEEGEEREEREQQHPQAQLHEEEKLKVKIKMEAATELGLEKKKKRKKKRKLLEKAEPEIMAIPQEMRLAKVDEVPERKKKKRKIELEEVPVDTNRTDTEGSDGQHTGAALMTNEGKQNRDEEMEEGQALTATVRLKDRRSSVGLRSPSHGQEAENTLGTSQVRTKRKYTRRTDKTVLHLECKNIRCEGGPHARDGSKYCSDDCGMTVAWVRLSYLMKRGEEEVESIMNDPKFVRAVASATANRELMNM